jgi:beta-1,4-mannosyl-glycoprotein beta-1,4-N-acetylglucosaminyltransferase
MNDTNKKQIIDCFTFYNELELLYYRLKSLYNYVDKFVLVEANQTFMGNLKQLYYKENKHLFKEFEDKIVHVIVDLPFINNINTNNNEQWINEKFQRNSIMEGINKLNLDINDLTIISDLDEIPDTKILLMLKENTINITSGISLEQDLYYYNLHCKHKGKWTLSKIVNYQELINKGPENVRQTKYPVLENGGWHLSYFGDSTFIQNKLKEFSHQEYNNDYYTNQERITNAIKEGKDLFGRGYVPIDYINIENNSYLPPLYNVYLLNFIHKNIN